MRWVSFYAWIASGRLTQALGKERSETGSDQFSSAGFWRTLGLALTWCIPPRDIRLFGLIEAPATAADFVYDHEVHAYHGLRSEALGVKRSSLRHLQDKSALSEVLTAQGVPMVPTVLSIAQGDNQSFVSRLSSDTKVFCKMRSGNQGRGAFAAWHQDGRWVGQTFQGKPLETIEALELAWRSLLKLDDALIQPYLINHPELESLALDAQTVTIRLISTWDQATVKTLLAILEIPTHRDPETQSTLYAILPIDAETGQVMPWPKAPPLPAKAQEAAATVLALLTSSWRIPFWEALVESSFKAHGVFPDVRSIAWDWAVTPEGPRLLEGNTGWGASVPQRLLGGFLKDGKI